MSQVGQLAASCLQGWQRGKITLGVSWCKCAFGRMLHWHGAHMRVSRWMRSGPRLYDPREAWLAQETAS